MNDGTTLTVAKKASQFDAAEFGEWADDRLRAVSNILDAVKDQVSDRKIEPLVGARIASCVAGSVFGYEEFHPRGMSPPAEQLLEAQLLEALNPQHGLERAGTTR